MIISYFSPVAAGFPSPAEAWSEHSLAITELLVPHPESTFFAKVRGNSMYLAGILDGDLLVVDRAYDAHHRSVIVAVLNESLTVKRLLLEQQAVILKAEHPRYPPLIVTPTMGFQIWGVVTFVIHSFHKDAVVGPVSDHPKQRGMPWA